MSAAPTLIRPAECGTAHGWRSSAGRGPDHLPDPSRSGYAQGTSAVGRVHALTAVGLSTRRGLLQGPAPQRCLDLRQVRELIPSANPIRPALAGSTSRAACGMRTASLPGRLVEGARREQPLVSAVRHAAQPGASTYERGRGHGHVIAPKHPNHEGGPALVFRARAGA